MLHRFAACILSRDWATNSVIIDRLFIPDYQRRGTTRGQNHILALQSQLRCASQGSVDPKLFMRDKQYRRKSRSSFGYYYADFPRNPQLIRSSGHFNFLQWKPELLRGTSLFHWRINSIDTIIWESKMARNDHSLLIHKQRFPTFWNISLFFVGFCFLTFLYHLLLYTLLKAIEKFDFNTTVNQRFNLLSSIFAFFFHIIINIRIITHCGLIQSE